MTFGPLPIPGAFSVELVRRGDQRGSFVRVYCAREFEAIGLHKSIVQINRSYSTTKGTIRGMHFQLPPASEVKLVSCLRGSVYDVMIDLRKGSPSLLHWHAETLQEADDRILIVPEGVAHGFQTLTDEAELLYFHTALYSPEHEAGVRYDDPLVHIGWPLVPSEVSKRDESHPLLTAEFKGIEL